MGDDLKANAESAGLLMAHCRSAKAFLHCSSRRSTSRRATNPGPNAPLGDNHRAMMPTYSIAKIASEVVVATMARDLDLPTIIARLNVPYGDNGGWPVFHLEMMLARHADPGSARRPNLFNPIHEDDIIATIPKLLEAATVPATIVNWGGDEVVALEEWCTYLGELVGKEPVFEMSDQALRGNPLDVTLMHELIGGTTVDWRDGMRRMAARSHPDLVS